MEYSEIEKVKKRHKEIANLIKGDDLAETLLNDLIESAADYVGRVSNMEAISTIQNFRLDRGKFKDFVSDFDKKRRFCHESLISNLYSFNRYMFNKYDGKTPIGGIYTLDPFSIRDRNAIGDWAGYFINGIKRLNMEESLKQ